MTLTFFLRCLRVLVPSIAKLSSLLVLKVMVTLTMTFALGVIYWGGPTSLLSEGPSPKHCQVIKLFSTKGPGDLDLCPQDHLLVRTTMSTICICDKYHCAIQWSINSMIADTVPAFSSNLGAVPPPTMAMRLVLKSMSAQAILPTISVSEILIS